MSNQHNCSSHSGDEEESLSLCDLPLEGGGGEIEIETEIGGEDQSAARKPKSRASSDFDFGSLAASLSALESEMCAADEVFFRGQIRPFRHSVSSATASNATRSFSRSESMDRNAGSGLRSSSTSRSSSTRSSSINSSASAGKPPSVKIRNQFHSFPSPKPYARAANAPRSSFSSGTPSANKRSSSAALWEVFRLGLVRTPEIELEDLKIRCGKYQSAGGGRSGDEDGESVSNGREQRRRRKNGGGGGMSLLSCKCSAEAVEPEKVGKRMAVENKEEKQRKHDVSTRHHRTFEWLRELSQPAVLNDVPST